MAIRNLGREIASGVERASARASQTISNIRDNLSTIKRGVANIGEEVQAKAADVLENGESKIKQPSDRLILQGKNLSNTIVNPLEQYASFTPLFTMACLETTEYNKPERYRKTGKLKHVIFSSAGRFDAERVKLINGKAPEYYIDDFKMVAVIAPSIKVGNSNAVKFEFNIYEPHSMGQFLQSLQVAARSANYTNYLIAPFVLKLEFLGYNDRQQILKPKDVGSTAPKYFVLKLTKVTFNVTESGSNYAVEAVPYNHQAFGDSTTTVYNDIKITGSTVEEALRTGPESLVAALNNVEKALKDAGKISVPDVYDIQFPENAFTFAQASASFSVNETVPSATIDPAGIQSILTTNVTPAGTTAEGQAFQRAVSRQAIGGEKNSVELPEIEANEIGKADYGFDQSSGGNFTFLKEDTQRDEETGVVNIENVAIDPTTRSFQFAQGQNITGIINTMILNSRYVSEAIKAENKEDGLVKHFMIDVQTEFLEFDPIVGDYAQKITYRVVPYLVHETVYSNPNATPQGYDVLEKQVSKAYNYIFTGQNVDILKLDIQIDNLFYVGMRPGSENKNPTASNPDSGGVAEDTEQSTETGGQGNSPAPQLTNIGRPRPKRDPALLEKSSSPGGDGATSVEQQVANDFHRAFLEGSSGDLVRLELEILGDPYWLVDHGMTNYFASASDQKSTITDDGTMNFTSGTVYIYITFKTPDDLNEVTGLYDFSSKMKVSPFSGIYRVTRCENVFNNGVFTQTLSCVRMIGQSVEFTDNPEALQAQQVTPDNSAMTVEGETVPERTSVIENPSDSETKSPNVTTTNLDTGQVTTTTAGRPRIRRENGVERIDIASAQRQARNAAMADARARGLSAREVEAIGARAGNLAGVQAFQSLDRSLSSGSNN